MQSRCRAVFHQFEAALQARWRLPVAAKESTAHSVTVGKSGVAGNDVHRMSALFKHHARGLQAKHLDGLRGRLTGFLTKNPAELPG